MKKHIALGLVASTLFLAGCCTSHHSIAWEYKTNVLADAQAGLDEKLGKLAVDGWTVQSVATEPDGRHIILLKRPKH